MAHIEELRPQHHSSDAGTLGESRLFDWTSWVVPFAAFSTLVWVFFLLWAAVRAIEIALA